MYKIGKIIGAVCFILGISIAVAGLKDGIPRRVCIGALASTMSALSYFKIKASESNETNTEEDYED